VNLSSVTRYARGKAPFIGIPYLSVAEGKYQTAVFHRQHLSAFLTCPQLTTAKYDEREHLLVLSGSKGRLRAEYRLKDLRAFDGGRVWQVRSAHETWARGQRTSAVKRNLSPEARKVIKLEFEIGKLERKREREFFNLSVPRSPMLPRLYGPASDSHRKQERRWHDEKPVRQRLGWLAHRTRKTWAEFYCDAEAILGRPIDSLRRHDRVCGRKCGPDRLDYLKHFAKYLGMADKPYRSNQWDPLEREKYGEHFGKTQVEVHRHAQIEYLDKLHRRAALDDEIANIRSMIADLQVTEVTQ
jgi:hypothetical protein